MSLTEFTRDVVPILQLILMLLGLFSVILLWWQIRQNALWNKLHTHHEFSKDTTSPDRERVLNQAMRKFGMHADEDLSKEIVDRIFDDEETLLAVKNFLNDYEGFCAAVNVGIIDDAYAYGVDAYRTIRAYRRFGVFIEEVRRRIKNPESYLELEKVALKWERRKFERRGLERKHLEKLKDALNRVRGVPKRYS